MQKISLKHTTAILLVSLAACAPQPSKDGPVGAREANLMHLAQTMQTGGDLQGAIDLYLRAIGQSQHRVEAHLALADLYQRNNMADKAEAILLAAKERQPEDPEINLRLAKTEINGGDAKKAMVYYDDGLRKSPDNIDLLNGKAVALDMLMRHKEAQSLYQKVLAAHPKDSDFVQNNLAMSYIMNGDYDAAIAQLEKIEGVADKRVMRQNLALAYGLKGNKAKAREWGMKDLSAKQFEDNMAFYRAYTEKLREQEKLTEKPLQPSISK